LKHGNEAIHPLEVPAESSHAAAYGWLLCALAWALLCAPLVFGRGLPGLGEGGSGPIPWAATMAVAVGSLWGHGIWRAGWPGWGRWVRGAAALAVPAVVLVLGSLGMRTAPLPLGLLPESLVGSEALAGLIALGVFLGLGRWGASVPPWALVVAVALDGAPGGWGLVATSPGIAPWGPATTAALLDFSPRAFVMESGAVDWMRHPEVYGPCGTDRIGPELRMGWTGSLAPHIALAASSVSLAWRSVRPLAR